MPKLGSIPSPILDELQVLLDILNDDDPEHEESATTRQDFHHLLEDHAPALIAAARQLEEVRRDAATQLAYHQATMQALKNLVFAGRISGGTAGRDENLCAALDAAERQISFLAANDAVNVADRVEQLENALHDIRNSILCPAGGVSNPEELLPIVNKGLNAKAEAIEAEELLSPMMDEHTCYTADAYCFACEDQKRRRREEDELPKF